jgi:hypothetical protein
VFLPNIAAFCVLDLDHSIVAILPEKFLLLAVVNMRFLIVVDGCEKRWTMAFFACCNTKRQKENVGITLFFREQINFLKSLSYENKQKRARRKTTRKTTS